jgi:hypothetical protein
MALEVSYNDLGPSIASILPPECQNNAVRNLAQDLKETERINQEKRETQKMADFKQSRLDAGYSPIDDGMSEFGDDLETKSTASSPL